MDYKKQIETEIRNYLTDFENHRLYEPIKYILEIGGKRIRPSVFLETVSIFGGNQKEAMPIALAIEIFHNFTLMHDDIMDNSSLRRGNQTVHEKWNVPSAILSGDAMLILSYQLIEKIPVEFQPEIYKEFNQMALWLCEGQQDDMDFEETETVSTQEYLEMIKNKTSVLIGFCLKSGAIFGKASETVKQKIYDFGINLGLAFQLQDDYLDLYPKSIKMGKTIGGDLLNKKKSIPYLIAINQGNEQDIYNIKKLINSEVKHRVNELISIFETINVKEKTEEIIANYFEKAKQNLADITEFDTKNLYNFAEMLMAREN